MGCKGSAGASGAGAMVERVHIKHERAMSILRGSMLALGANPSPEGPCQHRGSMSVLRGPMSVLRGPVSVPRGNFGPDEDHDSHGSAHFSLNKGPQD